MTFTPFDICRTALAYLSQTPEESEDLMDLSPLWLSTLLAESLDTENNIRRQKKLEELKEAPIVTLENMRLPLDMQEEICRLALPYGLASFYYTDDDNDYRAADFRARFIAALNDATVCEVENIVDAYQDEDGEE